MRQFFGYTVKRIQNLSASRIDLFLRCVTQLFYMSLLRIKPPIPSHPASLHGNALHTVDELLVTKMWKEGPLDLAEMDESVTNYTNFVMAILNGLDVIPGKSAYPIEWLAPWEQNMSPEEQLKKIEKKQLDFRIKTRAAVEAIYYMLSRGTKAVELQAEKGFKLFVPSTIDSSVQVPVLGMIDLYLGFASGRKVVIDWKTGKRSYIVEEKLRNHTQMLLYKRSIFEEYGVVPDTFIVSQEVFRSQINEQKTLEDKQLMLLREPFLIPVQVNYDEQWPYLQQLISEIWYVLQHLIYRPDSKIAQDKIKQWRPQSREGKMLHLEEHLIQDRPVPNIGKHCDFCSARSMCQKDNAMDWDVRKKQLTRATLSRLVTPSNEEVQQVIAESIPAVPRTINLHLFEGAPLSTHEKKIQKAYGQYNWPELGFEKVRAKSDSKIRWLLKFMPRHWTGSICPCVEGKWFWKHLLGIHPLVKQEELEYKEAQRRKRDADPNLKGTKIKPLRQSKILEQMLELCPIETCEHRINPHPKTGRGINPALLNRLVEVSEAEGM